MPSDNASKSGLSEEVVVGEGERGQGEEVSGRRQRETIPNVCKAGKGDGSDIIAPPPSHRTARPDPLDLGSQLAGTNICRPRNVFTARAATRKKNKQIIGDRQTWANRILENTLSPPPAQPNQRQVAGSCRDLA